MGKLIDMHLEGVKDPRTYSYPFFLFATGLIFWGASIVILANFTQDFSMSPLGSIQYFAVCAMGAMATALLGIKLKSYIARRNGAGREIIKGGRADEVLTQKQFALMWLATCRAAMWSLKAFENS